MLYRGFWKSGVLTKRYFNDSLLYNLRWFSPASYTGDDKNVLDERDKTCLKRVQMLPDMPRIILF